MKRIAVCIGFLDGIPPTAPIWWFGDNECIFGRRLYVERWLCGIILTVIYEFESDAEYHRAIQRVVWGRP